MDGDTDRSSGCGSGGTTLRSPVVLQLLPLVPCTAYLPHVAPSFVPSLSLPLSQRHLLKVDNFGDTSHYQDTLE